MHFFPRKYPTSNKILFTLILLSTLPVAAWSDEPPFLNYKDDAWVNQKMKTLSLDEKIAQLMMITVYPRQNETTKDAVLKTIRQYKPGGIIVMQGAPQKTVRWLNQFQSASQTPLLIAIDGEWGPAMRTDSIIAYPYAQALGAVQDSMLLYKMGKEIGEQLKKLGIHINFAPVADVNTNPENPVINFRSFGEEKENVAHKTWMLAKGMQDAGTIPVAKHFPGHGDTKSDSHLTLPLVSHTKQHLNQIESYPFRYLSEKGISGIMTAHLNVPALDPSGKPSSLSKKIVTGYLKNEIDFKGFIVTDAINMKGVQNQSGQAEQAALRAGNDMVEFVPDLRKAILSVKIAIANNKISREEIDEKCRKILALKRWVKLNNYRPVQSDSLTQKLNSPFNEVTLRKLIKGSFTVLKNNNILPVQHLEKQKIASVFIGSDTTTVFQKMLSNYTDVDHFCLAKNASEKELINLRIKLSGYDLVIAGIGGIHRYPSHKYGTSEIQRKAAESIIQECNTVCVFFGNAYALKYFSNIHHAQGLLLAYQENKYTEELSAQLIFGAFGANGKLPVTIDKRFPVNSGLNINGDKNFSYTIPEEAGIDAQKLSKIDSIALHGLKEKAYPGCQVLVAKDGQIVYHKCFGYLTYAHKQKVSKNNVYDWASLTKVTGPLPAIMKLRDEKKIDLDEKLSTYQPLLKETNKKNITVREVLAHQARLVPYIAFWQKALKKDGSLDRHYFRTSLSDTFSIRVSKHLFMTPDFYSIMMDTLYRSKLLPRKKYTYSGLSFYLFPKIIELATGTPYEQYLKTTFYKPLGANSVTFNAYKHFPMSRIVPTEKDTIFRKETMRGFVHDEGAAIMGGISGNAGLFGTTGDLAKIFQMYLQKGYFGGKRYISKATLNEFTRVQYPENNNRRGLGFDKPLIDNDKKERSEAYPAISTSKESFGHSGFTGTFAWADPKTGVLFIFMSNRVYPTRENLLLYKLNIRTNMQQAVYNSIIAPQQP